MLALENLEKTWFEAAFELEQTCKRKLVLCVEVSKKEILMKPLTGVTEKYSGYFN